MSSPYTHSHTNTHAMAARKGKNWKDGNLLLMANISQLGEGIFFCSYEKIGRCWVEGSKGGRLGTIVIA